MKKIFPTVLILLFVFMNCNKEEDGISFECTNLSTVEEIKAFLNDANSENILITAYQESDQTHNLIFEDGTNICFEDQLIEQIHHTAGSWSLEIKFQDGSLINLGFLGDPFPIIDENINLNPFGNTPLSAKLELSTPVEGKIQIRVIGRDGPDSDIIHCSDNFNSIHSIDILGLYPDHLNEVEISFTNKDCKERFKTIIEIQTEPLPDGFPEFGIITPYSDHQPNMVFLFNYRTPHRLFMTDAFGKVRWYGEWLINVKKRGMQRLKNGNLAFGGDVSGIIYEYTMLGEKVNEWQVQAPYERVHHDLIELPNGNFVVTVDKIDAPATLDYLIEVDRATGNTVQNWNLNEILPKRYTYIHSPSDWVHVNSVSYDESDHSLVISGRHQGIFKVNWNNELQWMLATPEGWENYEDYLLVPQAGPENLEWPWGQHSAMVMPDGNIFVFDNGFGREYGAAAGNYSRAVEYKVVQDGVGGTVEQVWSFGKEMGEALFSPIISDVDFLPETNTRLLVSGGLAYDHTYAGSAVNSITTTSDNPKVRLIEVDNNKNILFEMILSSSSQASSVYRAEKLRIYPE